MTVLILHQLKKLLTDSTYFNRLALLLIVSELLLLICILKLARYTEIDWMAYMQEVEGAINGTYDYAYLKGDTGPLVYPAGFVVVFALFYHVTDSGANVALAQCLFAAIYVLNLLVVVKIYSLLSKAEKYPPYLLVFLGLTGYRTHSIYVLRLFNDPVAMLLLYLAVLLLLQHRWTYGCALYSLAVSVKMNVLLFAPGMLVLLLLVLGWYGTLPRLVLCAFIQLLLAAPFLWTNPITYLKGAFNLGRQFMFLWTVNWRLLPEWVFLHRAFHVLLLVLHLAVLAIFTVKYWTKSSTLKSLVMWKVKKIPAITLHEIAWILLTSNFIGICFSRSLHYQFYVWYFHSLPMLLWSTQLHPIIRVVVLLGLEWVWNIYPSTFWSSLTLHLLHSLILVALYLSGPHAALSSRHRTSKDL